MKRIYSKKILPCFLKVIFSSVFLFAGFLIAPSNAMATPIDPAEYEVLVTFGPTRHLSNVAVTLAYYRWDYSNSISYETIWFGGPVPIDPGSSSPTLRFKAYLYGDAPFASVIIGLYSTQPAEPPVGVTVSNNSGFDGMPWVGYFSEQYIANMLLIGAPAAIQAYTSQTPALLVGMGRFELWNYSNATYGGTGNISLVSVPEPSTALLLSAGLGSILVWRRKK
jgi:hypothetical protein